MKREKFIFHMVQICIIGFIHMVLLKASKNLHLVVMPAVVLSSPGKT